MDLHFLGLGVGAILPAFIFVRALVQVRALAHQRMRQEAQAAQYFQLAAHCVAAALAASWLAATLSSIGTPDAEQRAQSNLQEGPALFVALFVLNEFPAIGAGLKKAASLIAGGVRKLFGRKTP